MNKQELATRFNEYYRANRQLWDAVMALSKEEFTDDTGYAFGSIRHQLVEMIATENLWVNYLWHGEVEFLHEAQFPTRIAIRREWDALEEEICDFIDELGISALTQKVHAPFIEEQSTRHIEDILLQVIEDNTTRRVQLMPYLHIVEPVIQK